MFENEYSNVITFRPRKLSPPVPDFRNPNEHVSVTTIRALVEHVARKLQIDQDMVEAMVLSSFGVRRFEEMKKSDFECAEKYLVDLLDDHALAP